MSIRGAATSAPLVIVAQNFAPGTTAADIESVMLKVGGELTSCRLVSSTPTVIAEMQFADPAGADNVIEQFNGKKVIHTQDLVQLSLQTNEVYRRMAAHSSSTAATTAERVDHRQRTSSNPSPSTLQPKTTR